MKHLTESDKLIIVTLANYLITKEFTKFQLSKLEEIGEKESMSNTKNNWEKFLNGHTEIQKEIVAYFESITSALNERISDAIKK